MAQFETSNWQKYHLAYLVIIIIVVILLVVASRGLAKEGKGRGIPERPVADGNGTAYYYGRGCENDSVGVLLDRISWASYVEKRTTLWYKVFIISVISTALISLLVLRKLPSPPQLIMLVVCIFIPIYAVHQMRYVHGDIHNDYNIKHNVDLLRERLQVKPGKGVLPAPSCAVPPRTLVMNPK